MSYSNVLGKIKNSYELSVLETRCRKAYTRQSYAERVSVSDSIFYSKMCVFDEAWNASESQTPVLLSQLNTHLSASPYPSLNSVSTEWLTYCPAPVPCMSAPLIIPFLSFPLSHAFLLLTLSGDRCLPLQLPLWTFPALQTERGNTSQREPEAPGPWL